jgi:predicted nucleotidyltransferase
VETPIGALPATNLDILGHRIRVRIVRYLARRGGEYTGRSLARALGEQPKQALSALRLLWQAGLLVRKAAPPAHLYSLNHDHYLVRQALLPAFQAEARWLDALGQEVRQIGGEAVESVLLFGSLSRSTTVADPGSDVDVAVLVDEPGHVEQVRRALDARQGALHERFGHAVSPMVLSIEQFRRRFRKRNPLVRSMVREGEVLTGRPVAELLSGNASRW